MKALTNLRVSKVIDPADNMYRLGEERHYFGVGLSSIYAIVNVCRIREGIPGGGEPVRDILDFGCGYGRVARFLRAQYPEATIWVTDLIVEGVNFCVETLGCTSLADPLLPRSMDVIWLGSVLTHLPEIEAKNLLNTMSATLRRGGILVFSTQGRYSRERLRNSDWSQLGNGPSIAYGMPEAVIKFICDQYDQTDYGYADYAGQEGYGIAIVKPDWYFRQCASQEFRQIYFQERGMDHHHDVLGFMRTNILETDVEPWWSLTIGFTPPGELAGNVEGIINGVLEGWVMEPANPTKPVELKIFIDGTYYADVIANEYRVDLARAGLAEGNCCFKVIMPTSITNTSQVQVRRATDGLLITA